MAEQEDPEFTFSHGHSNTTTYRTITENDLKTGCSCADFLKLKV